MPKEHPQYIATLRAVFRAEDDIEAILIADQIKTNGEKDLEEDEGDSLDVTQVTANYASLQPEESLAILRQARNACIRTKTRQGYDMGREIDKFIFILENRTEKDAGMELSGYEWDHYLDVVREVIAGGNPTH